MDKSKNFQSANLKALIKSKYNIMRIFSFLDKRRKLKIIIYNNNYQKLFGINIDDYINMSGKYFEGEKNGKGREYWLIRKVLLFEGEYLKSKRHGKGEEYTSFFNSACIGEYFNGKRHGKGIEYINGISIYNFYGEYFDGYKVEGKGYDWDNHLIIELNKNGKGKEYYSNGTLKFEGEYLHGKKLKGKGYDINGNLLCEIKNGNGNIKEYNEKGLLMFEGRYLNGNRYSGKEIIYYSRGNIKYKGNYINGRRIGKEYNSNGILKFEGIFSENNKYISGKRFNERGDLVFEGEYLNG